MSNHWKEQGALEDLLEQIEFKKTQNGMVYIVAPVGPLYWSMSHSEDEAIEKLRERIGEDR